MKAHSSIASLFGRTQREMAVLLGVGVSQYSMFECGKRSLPLDAQQLLAEMLLHRQTSESESKHENTQQAHGFIRKAQLERLLKDNEYRQLLLLKKTAIARKKEQAHLRASQLDDFLSRIGERKTPGARTFKAFAPAPKKPAHDHDLALLKLEIELELVALEKLLIESKLRKLAPALQDKGLV